MYKLSPEETMATKNSPTPTLTIEQLIDALNLLKRCGFPQTRWHELGVTLGLHKNILDTVERDSDTTDDCLTECLSQWLSRADNVDSKGGATFDSLSVALKSMNENAAADKLDQEKRNTVLPIDISNTHHPLLSQSDPVSVAQQNGATAQQDSGASEEISPPELTIMVVGKTGVGKSTLINSMLGKKVAKTPDSIHPSNHDTIEEYTGTVCGTPVVFYDTRGLGDPKLNNKELMKKFKQQIKQCGDQLTVFICQEFTGRIGDSVEQFAELLAKYFKNDYTIWKSCSLVLTKANLYDSDSNDESDEDDRRSDTSPEEIIELKMKIQMKEWANKFLVCLRRYNVPEEIIMNMPMCVAGNKRHLKLPLTDNWIETIMDHFKTRTPHFQSAHQMGQHSQDMAVYFSGAVGGIVGAFALPVIRNKIAQAFYKKTVGDRERKEFHKRKISEITKKKD